MGMEQLVQFLQWALNVLYGLSTVMTTGLQYLTQMLFGG